MEWGEQEKDHRRGYPEPPIVINTTRRRSGNQGKEERAAQENQQGGKRVDENWQRRGGDELQEDTDTKHAMAKEDMGEKRKMHDHTENMTPRSMAGAQ